jgi:hypothetical protein
MGGGTITLTTKKRRMDMGKDMKKDIVRTIMANYEDLNSRGAYVDVAVRRISFGKWSGFRVFRNGTAYQIEMHDRNKFRFWHEIRESLPHPHILEAA